MNRNDFKGGAAIYCRVSTEGQEGGLTSDR
jgi:DNA invertase Pin-like site-specific DNA recombinase